MFLWLLAFFQLLTLSVLPIAMVLSMTHVLMIPELISNSARLSSWSKLATSCQMSFLVFWSLQTNGGSSLPSKSLPFSSSKETGHQILSTSLRHILFPHLPEYIFLHHCPRTHPSPSLPRTHPSPSPPQNTSFSITVPEHTILHHLSWSLNPLSWSLNPVRLTQKKLLVQSRIFSAR